MGQAVFCQYGFYVMIVGLSSRKQTSGPLQPEVKGLKRIVMGELGEGMDTIKNLKTK